MPKKWTENQKKSINIDSKNVLVAAAAGSGKTTVLVERVINKIRTGQKSIEKLLLVTFTNAAAAQMRQKIGDALFKELQKNPENKNLQKQIVLLPLANICTIHSFCQNLLKNNFYKLGIPAEFKIADKTESELLLQQAIEEIFEEKYILNNPDFLNLVDSYGGKKDDNNLIQIIKKILNFSKATPDPIFWLNECSQKFNLENISENKNNFLSNNWGGEILKSFCLKLERILQNYRKIIHTAENTEGISKYCDVLETEQTMLHEIYLASKENDWDKTYLALQKLSFNRLPPKNKDAEKETAEYVRKTRENIKKRINEIKKSHFHGDSKRIMELLLPISSQVRTLCELVTEVDNRFSSLKRKDNLLDFNDLEHFTLKLLRNEYQENSDEISNKFTEVFIDEYQDTNLAQNEIFKLISKGSNLFVVGDVKQSIYRFRNTEPQLFLQKQAEYTSDPSKGAIIQLSHNFRSHRKIIDTINFIFERLMSTYVGEVNYDDDQKMLSFENNPPSTQNSDSAGDSSNANDVGSIVELHVIEKKFDEADDTLELCADDLQTDAITREASLVAKRIYDLVENEKTTVYDKALGGNRPIQYSDIAILARTTKNVTNVFADRLEAQGIPVFSEQSAGYFSLIEIATILSSLQVLDNPLQDIPTVAVMRSPMFNFTDNELAWIRLGSESYYFYSAVEAAQKREATQTTTTIQTDAAANNETETPAAKGEPLQNERLNEKCKRFIEKLELYKFRASYMSLQELIRFILLDTGYENHVQAMPDAEVRIANLRLLCERAGRFESSERKSIFEFIQYAETMLENDFDLSVARISSENSNAVRIMSIHKSKGLEFPAVFVVNCGAKFNLRDLNGEILYDYSLGIGADCVIPEKMVKYHTIAKQAIVEKKRLELLSEEMRILYVALTRAQQHLFIFGGTLNIEKSAQKWADLGAIGKPLSYNISVQDNYLDWLGIASPPIDTFYHKAHETFANQDSRPQPVLPQHFVPSLPPQSLQADEYTYPYPDATIVPTKLSVSEVLKLQNSKPTIKLREPEFMQQYANTMTPALQGRLTHFIMQNLDLGCTNSPEEISWQVSQMVELQMLSPEMAAEFTKSDIDKIYAFFCSDLGQRMKKSGKIEREVKFFTEFPAKELLPDKSLDIENEKILLQGVIDCYFEEDDAIVIIDYKTGAERMEYAEQTKLYAEALTKILNKQVKETHVYNL